MKLNHALLKKIFVALGIPVPAGKLVLFSVRGALPRGSHTSWSDSHNLTPVKVDYKHMRCSIGIWNPGRKKIFIVSGSTVPHYDEVLKAAAKGGKGSNQLEPGYYTDYYKGEHLMGKPRGHQALRQTGNRFVRRSSHKPPYSKNDRLYFSNPFDNLHCAWNTNPKKEGYSSAGCIVVSGTPFCKRLKGSTANSGSWKNFHKLIYDARQNKFSLLLLEYHVLAGLRDSKKVPAVMCYGSQGDRVKKLQSLLKHVGLYRGPVSGKLGVRTYKAWNAYGFGVR